MTLPNDLQEQLLAEAIRSWNVTFGGVSGLDLARKIQVPHSDVMETMESWVEAGRGNINANVVLNIVNLPSPNSSEEITFTPITTHIFFPSREVLKDHFFNSGQARSEPPEYKKRLMCGEQQLALCFFTEEVLARYFNHLDWYEMDDSSAGGHISTKSSAPPDRYVDIRFGKGKSEDGRTFVTAIYKDLYDISDWEQRHWHAHEINRPTLDPNDSNFGLFAARTYEGSWVDFPKPIQELQDSLTNLNRVFDPDVLFRCLENEHLRMPVENTNKALADSCSELYKIVGSDSLKAKPLKKFLRSHFSVEKEGFVHDSGRSLSAMQLLECLESELGVLYRLSVAIKAVAKHRVEADHKVITTTSNDVSYSDKFVEVCKRVVVAAEILVKEVEARNVT